VRHTILSLVLVAGCGSNLTLPDAGVPLDMQVPGPTMLASAQTFTPCLGIDSRNLYWSDFGSGAPTIMSVPLAGGAATTLVSGGDKYGCVVSDGNDVYYADNGSIMKVHFDGSAKTTLASGQHVLGNRLSFSGSLFFITDVYGNVDAYNGKNAILEITPAGSLSVFAANVVGLPSSLASDSGGVYWADHAGVFFAPRSNPANTISFGQSALHDNTVAVGGGRLAMNEVMAISSGDVAVFRVDGTGRTVVLPSLANPLAVDDRGVYVNHSGALERLALDGSGAKLLATQTPRALALSADHIYFTDGAAIYSLPK
jgi:hypothetical protein